jgi:hypothetical protein
MILLSTRTFDKLLDDDALICEACRSSPEDSFCPSCGEPAALLAVLVLQGKVLINEEQVGIGYASYPEHKNVVPIPIDAPDEDEEDDE